MLWKNNLATGAIGSGNFVQELDIIKSCPWDVKPTFVKKIRDQLVQEAVLKLEYLGDAGPGVKFNRRITALCWHPKYPYTYAVGSKFGEIVVGSVNRVMSDSTDRGWKSINRAEIDGTGAGGSITAMQFDKFDHNILYRTSIDSSVSRVDLSKGSAVVFKYFDFASYQKWFTALGIDFSSRTLLAGDNSGNVMNFNLHDGKKLGQYALHKSKIHHIEFSKKNPDIFVTAGISHSSERPSVKIWDIRKLNLKSPLKILTHNAAVNTARFNPLDGTKLLTSDQEDEIRVYDFQGSDVKDEPIIIKHHHRQFQHITPVQADWHPSTDLIVIGNYPKKGAGPKIIEFYNPDDGKCVGHITPPVDKIVSLNAFNPTGELLASGINSELVIWRPSTKLEELWSQCVGKKDDDNGAGGSQSVLSQELKDKLRGRNRNTGAGKGSTPKRSRKAREYSPASGDENDAKNSKRPRKVPAKPKKK